jgi:hypothetical protein
MLVLDFATGTANGILHNVTSAHEYFTVEEF